MNELRGARVGLGPMASDNFTTLHNLVFRGCGIHTRYVGVFGYISGQTDGWMLTEQKIVRDLGVGRDFVRAALHNFEEAGCLVRSRLRRPDGTLGDAVWFITDLPAQLQQLGFDRDTIDARVQATFTAWHQARAGAPEQTSRSEPMSGKPTLADPTLDFGTRKKTNKEEDQPGRQAAPAQQQPAKRAPASGGLPACLPSAPRRTGTDPSSVGAALLRSLNLERPVTQQVVRQCHEHVTRLLETWDEAALAHHLTAEVVGGRPENLMGLLTWVVRNTAPRHPNDSAPHSDIPPWCGHCGAHYPDERARVNGRFRVVHDRETDQEMPCETCHPDHGRYRARRGDQVV